MTFNLHTNLFRQLFNNVLFKGLICGIATFNVLSGPTFAVAANPINDAAEYKEWGLDYPGKTPSKGTTADSEKPVERPVSQAPVSQAPVSNPSGLMGGTVPQDIAGSFEQAAVHVIVFYADGKHIMMPGWIVDTERRIILTFALMKDATRVHIAYPQVPSDDKDSMIGSPAVILQYDTKMDVAYLQAKTMPQGLAHLTTSNAPQTRPEPQRTVSHKPTAPMPPAQGGHNGGQQGHFNGGGFNGGQQGSFNGGHLQGNGNGGYTPPQQQANPLVGKWYLQDVVNGTQIQIAVAFGAQGQFAMEVMSVDAYGQQNYDSDNGTYTIQGNTLTVNTSDGPEQSRFWFENGVLYVQLVANGTTFAFQQAA